MPAKFGVVLVAAAAMALVLGASAATGSTVNDNSAPMKRASAVKKSPDNGLTQVSEWVNSDPTQADQPNVCSDTARPPGGVDAN